MLHLFFLTTKKAELVGSTKQRYCLNMSVCVGRKCQVTEH